MTEMYATGVGAPKRLGQCAYIWHWEDVDMNCPKQAIPGGPECDDHLIARMRATPIVYRRWFGAA